MRTGAARFRPGMPGACRAPPPPHPPTPHPGASGRPAGLTSLCPWSRRGVAAGIGPGQAWRWGPPLSHARTTSSYAARSAHGVCRPSEGSRFKGIQNCRSVCGVWGEGERASASTWVRCAGAGPRCRSWGSRQPSGESGRRDRPTGRVRSRGRLEEAAALLGREEGRPQRLRRRQPRRRVDGQHPCRRRPPPPPPASPPRARFSLPT